MYSPHVYGPSVYSDKPFFNSLDWCHRSQRSGCTNDFPHNLGQLYEDNFWEQRGDVPVVVGEFGGWNGDADHDSDGKDARFQAYAIDWFRERGVGVFYFGLTSDSADTGGLLQSDYTQPVRDGPRHQWASRLPRLLPSRLPILLPSRLPRLLSF